GAGVSDRRVYLSTRRLPRGKCHRPEREDSSQRHRQRFHSRFRSCARSSTSIIATLPSLPLARHRKGSAMANTSGRDFDLNIEKVLDSWTVSHAIRELIANALDEQAISHTRDVQIARVGHTWHIRDFGRGLRHTHLTQNENAEKQERESEVV